MNNLHGSSKNMERYILEISPVEWGGVQPITAKEFERNCWRKENDKEFGKKMNHENLGTQN